MSCTDQDVRALEHLALRIRQDAHGCRPWDAEGTHVVFARELIGLHLLTALEMVMHHAADPDAKTPAAIKRPFLPDLPRPVKRDLAPRRADECPVHPGQYIDNCGGCRADLLAGPEPAPEAMTAEDARRLAREAVQRRGA